ncbi:ketopantoate reductase family protein [Achromobacter insuavis]|uniref:2-dehydropantoate 2-reductase n=1 Tax=Achromobacter insuavis AXX-A TaxID=1003200 RepID=F7STT0_9BURK|nr:2-dehydropantoate 2-reductase [Achromobacter insuavis]EGP48531.1 2-dehydropantoate 2-reductase [Achromobacter insuavis AXX-A]
MEKISPDLPSKPLSRVGVIGAGAIGGFLGVQLAHAGVDVRVIARGQTLAAIRKHGWRLDIGGRRLVARVLAIDSEADCGFEQDEPWTPDVVVVAVKSHSLPTLAPVLARLAGPDTVIVPAINGLPWWFNAGKSAPAAPLASTDPHGELGNAVPPARIIGAVVYPSCSCPEPGITRHGAGSRLVFGNVMPDADEQRLSQWVDLLRRCGLDAHMTDAIRAEVWNKLLGNACFNPVSMLTGSATDVMIDDPAVRALFTQMMSEMLALGHAQGIAPAVSPADRIAITRRLGHVKTSMLQDAEAGRPVELAAILGAAMELAERTGVEMPCCRTVHALAALRARTLSTQTNAEAIHGDLR